MALNWYGPQIDAQTTAGVVAGLNVSAEAVLADMIPRTPRDTGQLRDSFEIAPATTASLQAAIYSNLEYAVKQHESFRNTHTVGGPKFLEKAMWDYRNQFLETLASEVRKATGE